MHNSVNEKINLIESKIDYYLVFHDEIELRKLVNTQIPVDQIHEYNAEVLANDLLLAKAESQPLFYSFFNRMMGM